MRRTVIAAGVLATGFLVAGCATKYAPSKNNNGGFGYTEREVGEDQIVLATAATSSVSADVFWERRARELCPEGDYKKNIFAKERGVVNGMLGEMDAGGRVVGTLSCAGLTERRKAASLAAEQAEASKE